MTQTYSGADVVCPHCALPVPGARLTYRTIAGLEADAVAAQTGAPRAEMFNRAGRKHARARWLLWTRLRDVHGWPLGRIARVCGGFDPVTVLKAMQTIEREAGSGVDADRRAEGTP